MTGRHDTIDDSASSDRLIDDALGRDREALRRGRPHDATRAAAVLLAATPAAGASGLEGLAAKSLLAKAFGAKIVAGIIAAGAGTAIVLTVLPATEDEGGRVVGHDAHSRPAPEVVLPPLPSPRSETPTASTDDARANEVDDARMIGPVAEPRQRVAPSIVSPQQPEVVSTDEENAVKTATPSERTYRQSNELKLPFTIIDGSGGRKKE